MTRYEMLEEARKRGPELPVWKELDAQGKESLCALMVDSFIVKEQIGSERGALLLACCSMAAYEQAEKE